VGTGGEKAENEVKTVGRKTTAREKEVTELTVEYGGVVGKRLIQRSESCKAERSVGEKREGKDRR